MGHKYVKLAAKVSAQTACHLDQMSRAGQCSIGRVIDRLVRDRMIAQRDPVHGRTRDEAN